MDTASNFAAERKKKEWVSLIIGSGEGDGWHARKIEQTIYQ